MDIILETIKTFTQLLVENNIPYTFEPLFDGGKWVFPNGGDVAIHSGTYNSQNGFVESYGMEWDKGDVSSCTVEEMIRRLKNETPCKENEYNYSYEDFLNSLSILNI